MGWGSGFGGIDLGAGRRLTFAGLDRGAVWLGVAAAALILLMLLYRYERRLVPRRTGLALLALRLLAASALVATLFEPVAERTRREKVPDRVVLGVDRSASLDVVDVLSDGDPNAPNSVRSRRETVRELLGGPWLERVRGEHGLDTRAFARSTAAATPEALVEALAGPAPAGDREADATDWTGVLEAATEIGDGRPMAGVVLLSDGRATLARPDAADRALARLKERGVAVYPVLIGSTDALRDAAVAAVTAPDSIDRGQVARIDVTIKADGFEPGTEVPVTLEFEKEGAAPMRQVVRAQPGGARPVVTFRVPTEGLTPGSLAMALSVGPIPADARPDNDRRAVTITVTDDRARVFLLAGEPSWEFQYLRNALVRDPRVDLTAAAIRQPPAGPAAKPTYETGLPPEDPNAPGSGSTPDPLGAFDLIILIDPAPGDLDDAAWARLDRFVAGRGGALVLVCGSRGGVGLGAGEAAARLLPVRDVRPREPGPDAAPDPDRPALPPGLRIVPDPSALDGPWPMLLLGDDPEASRETWRALPPQPRVRVGAAKPSAVVLARAASMADEGDAGPDDDSAMIAAMPYGLGKVLWLGTNATWRWRFRAGDRIHHRFWGQVIPWAADAPLAVGNRLLAFGAVPPRVAEDVRPIIRARLSDAATTGPAASMLVAAKIRRADQPPDAADPVALVPLRPRDDQSRVFEAEAPALPPGSYRITLEWPALDAALRAEGPPLEAPLEVTTRPTSERIELAAARDPLERLAAATGGAVLTPDRVDEIPDLLARRATVRTRTESARLWDRPEALLLFLGLMTIEWITRKRAGLP